ncbi:MAG: hypothetical protein JXB33_03405 [Clostridia bacterium]|nr:hypothetical protein [Clostridia bacterium]
MKRFIAPIIIFLIFATLIYMAFNRNIMPADALVDTMIELCDSGTLIADKYVNEPLGIEFSTPYVEGSKWQTIRYQDQFARRPTLAHRAAQAWFVTMQPEDGPYPSFILIARYMDIPYSSFRRESSEEFAQRMRDDHVRAIIAGNRDDEGMFTKEITYTNIMPVEADGEILYEYSSENIVTGDHFVAYAIRIDDFAYWLQFYGFGGQVDPAFIDEVIGSIRFTGHQVKIKY